MKYNIRHEETLVGFFEVEAESKEQAIESFYRDVSDGKIDFSDLEMVHSEDKVVDKLF